MTILPPRTKVVFWAYATHFRNAAFIFLVFILTSVRLYLTKIPRTHAATVKYKVLEMTIYKKTHTRIENPQKKFAVSKFRCNFAREI